MTRCFILFGLALLPFFSAAQTCPCCQKSAAGQAAYDQGNYKSALKQWQQALTLADAADCPELKNLVAKVQHRLKNPSAPDRDKDGVADAEDQCPDQPGRVDGQGCPAVELMQDDDEGGITVPGQIIPRQDVDGDGIDDPEDDCPSVAGLKSFRGCPAPALLDSVGALPEMVLIPGGTFTLGDSGVDYSPAHSVTLSDFYMSITEVTFQHFEVFCQATGAPRPADNNWGRGQRPVINVDWFDAVEYCNWLSQQQHLTPVYTLNKGQRDTSSLGGEPGRWLVTLNPDANGYRLPTEAEWEYAARAGGKRVQFGNSRDTCDPAQINFNTHERLKHPNSLLGENRLQTLAAGHLSHPNALGLHDMSGNVQEWCADRKGPYVAQAATNPTGAAQGAARVVRGGSWAQGPNFALTTWRSSEMPDTRNYLLGFRVVANSSPAVRELVARAQARPSILHQADQDKDGLLDQDDGCPGRGGPKANAGCPYAFANHPEYRAPAGLVAITGGDFLMGDLFGDGNNNEKPHPVGVPDFYLGETEVTFAAFDAFCTATGRPKPDDNGWGRGQRPVINVDWYDAVQYCNWLSEQQDRTPAYLIDASRQDPTNTNRNDPKRWLVVLNPYANGYRLPTEAEWEYAAREGGKKVPFGHGKNTADPAQINFDPSEKCFRTQPVGDCPHKTLEVGSLHSPNALGLHDMSGNVEEWCGDWCNWLNIEPLRDQYNPRGETEGGVRSLRGGSWLYPAHYCRTSSRNAASPALRSRENSGIGFRLAASLP